MFCRVARRRARSQDLQRVVQGRCFLNYMVSACLSVALLLSVLALLKERRLRRALQLLLQRLLKNWRIYERSESHRSRGRDDDSTGDRM